MGKMRTGPTWGLSARMESVKGQRWILKGQNYRVIATERLSASDARLGTILANKFLLAGRAHERRATLGARGACSVRPLATPTREAILSALRPLRRGRRGPPGGGVCGRRVRCSAGS